MRLAARFAAISGVAIAFALPAVAQTPTPLGDQQIANTTTPGIQDEVAVAVDPHGHFFVIWRAEAFDGNLSAIVGRRFNARTGQPLSNEILINLTTDGDQRNPAIAMADDGRFVVVWEGPDSEPATPGLFASLREADGTPIVAEFPVNLTTGGAQRRPAVAMHPSGGFLVVWQSESLLEGSTVSQEIVGRLFPPTFPEDPASTEIAMNIAQVAGDQQRPAVAAAPEIDAWLVGWEGPDAVVAGPTRAFPIPSTWLRTLTLNGGGPAEIRLNTAGSLWNRTRLSLAASGSRAVAAWQETDGSLFGVWARRIEGGAPVECVPQTGDGCQERINVDTAGDQREPSVAMDEDGDFVTVWVSAPTVAAPSARSGPAPEGSPIVIQGKKSSGGGTGGAPSGRAAGDSPVFQINSSGDGFVEPWLAMEPKGRFVVAWRGTDQDDPDDGGVFYRRFSRDLFADDFESQDACAWSDVAGGPGCG